MNIKDLAVKAYNHALPDMADLRFVVPEDRNCSWARSAWIGFSQCVLLFPGSLFNGAWIFIKSTFGLGVAMIICGAACVKLSFQMSLIMLLSGLAGKIDDNDSGGPGLADRIVPETDLDVALEKT